MLRHSLGGTYRSLKEEYLLQSHREMRIDVAHRSRYLIFTLFVFISNFYIVCLHVDVCELFTYFMALSGSYFFLFFGAPTPNGCTAFGILLAPSIGAEYELSSFSTQ